MKTPFEGALKKPSEKERHKQGSGIGTPDELAHMGQQKIAQGPLLKWNGFRSCGLPVQYSIQEFLQSR